MARWNKILALGICICMILEGVPVYGEEANPTQQIEENVQDEVQDNKQKDNIALQSDVATTASGQCGENAYWKLTSDGVFTIYGTGPMTRYGYDWDDYTPKHDWNVYLKTIKKVVVEDGITTISPYSFYDSTSLKEVVIPKSVTQIGEDAFHWCKNVEKVSIDGLESWCGLNLKITIPIHCNLVQICILEEQRRFSLIFRKVLRRLKITHLQEM